MIDVTPYRPSPPTRDPVDECGLGSFPASDPPSGWAGRDDAARATGRPAPDGSAARGRVAPHAGGAGRARS
jgi:hypothetical protein